MAWGDGRDLGGDDLDEGTFPCIGAAVGADRVAAQFDLRRHGERHDHADFQGLAESGRRLVRLEEVLVERVQVLPRRGVDQIAADARVEGRGGGAVNGAPDRRRCLDLVASRREGQVPDHCAAREISKVDLHGRRGTSCVGVEGGVHDAGRSAVRWLRWLRWLLWLRRLRWLLWLRAGPAGPWAPCAPAAPGRPLRPLGPLMFQEIFLAPFKQTNKFRSPDVALLPFVAAQHTP